MTLENGGVWSTSSGGKLLDSYGNVVADLNDELHLYCFWYHGGMFWNKKSELYPVAHLGALGYRFCKVMKKEMGISAYVSTKKETFSLRSFLKTSVLMCGSFRNTRFTPLLYSAS